MLELYAFVAPDKRYNYLKYHCNEKVFDSILNAIQQNNISRRALPDNLLHFSEACKLGVSGVSYL